MNSNTIPQNPTQYQVQNIAYNFGWQDGISGATCVPEMFFVRKADQVAYCQGYEHAAGATLTTQQILRTSLNW